MTITKLLAEHWPAVKAISLRIHAHCGFRQVGYRERIGQMHGIWRDTVLVERRAATP